MTPEGPTPTGCLARIGLAAVIAGGAILAVVLTVLVPPWVEATSQRQVGLYFSHHVKVKEQHFVGYDVLLSGSKGKMAEPAHSITSGETFDVTEFRIFWPLLFSEWATIVIGAIGFYAVCSRRLRGGRTTPDVGTAAIPEPGVK
jgi:hypothetical protein